MSGARAQLWAAVLAAGLTVSARLAAATETQWEAAAKLQEAPWVIALAPSAGEPVADTLYFRDGVMTSDALAEQGFVESAYTATVGSDGLLVWEALQTSRSQGVAFWRGELQDSTIQGSLITQPLDGSARAYTFTGHPFDSAQGGRPERKSRDSQPQHDHEPNAATP